MTRHASPNAPSCTRTCVHCNGNIPRPGEYPNRKYCSRGCRLSFEKKNRAAKMLPAYRDKPGSAKGRVGAISEMVVAVDLMRRGYDTFRAIIPTCSCDLIAVRGAQVIRVEVRTGYMKVDGTMNTIRHPKDAGRQDVFAMVHGDIVVYDPPFGCDQ